MHTRHVGVAVTLLTLFTAAHAGGQPRRNAPTSPKMETQRDAPIAQLDPAAARQEAKRRAALPAAELSKVAAAAKVALGRLSQPTPAGAKPKTPTEVVGDAVRAGGFASRDVDSTAFLVTMQAAKDSREDAVSTRARIKAIAAAKRCPRVECVAQMKPTADFDQAAITAIQARMNGRLDALSEMGEMESLRLQMAMDRMQKMMSTLSNIMKKLSETSSSITQNLK